MEAKKYWTCSKYRDKAILCKARAVTNNEENVIFTLTWTHTNHGSELMTIQAKLIINEAVSRSAENPLEKFKIKLMKPIGTLVIV